MLIEWRDEWLVGEVRIDDDHRAMVHVINRLHGAVDQGDGKESVIEIMKTLLELTKEHFSYEECLMLLTDYPGAAGHQEVHMNLFSVVNIMAYNMEPSDEEIVLDTIAFFEDWFIDHVETEDAPFGRFLTARSTGMVGG